VKADRLKIPHWAFLFPCIGPEFAGQGGFGWLEHNIASTNDRDGYVDVIVRGMQQAMSFSELAQWTSCLTECLRHRAQTHISRTKYKLNTTSAEHLFR
jgi:hypothetical protein